VWDQVARTRRRQNPGRLGGAKSACKGERTDGHGGFRKKPTPVLFAPYNVIRAGRFWKNVEPEEKLLKPGQNSGKNPRGQTHGRIPHRTNGSVGEKGYLSEGPDWRIDPFGNRS